jgi:hypothetical protein
MLTHSNMDRNTLTVYDRKFGISTMPTKEMSVAFKPTKVLDDMCTCIIKHRIEYTPKKHRIEYCV